ncbi:MAG: hypothetical protein RL095_2553 [Verrucomicrobiota bacterium]|jgi:GxxExxY protein
MQSQGKHEFEDLSHKVIGCALEVHRFLGPGLLESTYEKCLSKELELQGIDHQCQVPMPVEYKGLVLECGYRLDILAENRLILELKSVDKIDPIHKAQLMTYLKLAKIKPGY